MRQDKIVIHTDVDFASLKVTREERERNIILKGAKWVFCSSLIFSVEKENMIKVKHSEY